MDQVSSSTVCIPHRTVFRCGNCGMENTYWSYRMVETKNIVSYKRTAMEQGLQDHHRRILSRPFPTRKQLMDLFSKLYQDKSVLDNK